MTESKKTLQESIEDLKKLKKKQEKALNLRAARATQMTIEGLEKRLEKGEKK
jgi:hypothetical protein